MMTVSEVSRLSGVSIRTLHYYDQIGLLTPTELSESGYRLYDEAALGRLQLILLFRALEFSLSDIKRIISDPGFDRDRALAQQAELLALKRDRLDRLIRLVDRLKTTGVNNMDFSAFDSKKIEEYSEQAKAQWGHTDAYREFEQKNTGQSKEEQALTGKALMAIFTQFGQMMDCDPADENVQQQVKKLQDFITGHYYTCTPEILAGLGQMYCAGGEFTENIDKAGGEGCAVFAARAIDIYCKNA